MFQVLIQSAMRQMKSRFRLPAPPNKSPALILKLMLGGSIFLLVIFSILPTG